MINLKADQYKRLPGYEACTDDKLLNENSALGYSYTADAAKQSCYQKETEHACGCYSPYLPMLNDFTSRTTNSCLWLGQDVESELGSSVLNIHCFTNMDYGDRCDRFEPPCDDVVYSYEKNENEWPMDGFKLAFYKDVINNTEYVPERRSKFSTYFEVFDEYDEAIENDTELGMTQLQQDELIERNFIQLKVRFQVTMFVNK